MTSVMRKLPNMGSKQHAHLMSLVNKMVPPVSPKMHKGQAGRIGVLGGSGDYSGAPYFSSMGAMRFGADLAHVICEPTAGAVIKTYSPDLIVHNILDPKRSKEDIRKDLKGILSRLHVLVVGPGLGRDDHMQDCARIAFELARELDQMSLVVDADGLWLIQTDPSVILNWPGVPRIILTPNIMEFKRLCKTMNIDESGDPDTLCPRLARALHNLTIIQKGSTDVISNGLRIPDELLSEPSASSSPPETLDSEVEGGLKRVGGQGDILSGSTGVLLAWGSEWVRGSYAHVGMPPPSSKAVAENVPLLAAYGASVFNRTVSRRGWEAKRRAMVTNDLVELVGPVFEELFGRSNA